MRLRWEKSANGLEANLYSRGRIQTPNPRGVALMKIQDVDWIRAVFGGDAIGFEPYVRLWIDGGKEGTGLTVFMHNYPIEKDTVPLPDVCVRWAEWRGQRAIEEFVAVDDKR